MRACTPSMRRGAFSSRSFPWEDTGFLTKKLVCKLGKKAIVDRDPSICVPICKHVGPPTPAHTRQERFPAQRMTCSSSCFLLHAACGTSCFPRLRRTFVVHVLGPRPSRGCHVPRGFDTDHVSEVLVAHTCRIFTSKDETRALAREEAW